MGALDGILVVAIEQAVAGPLCTVRLADAGARVIKVERAEGETARHYDSTVQGTSAYFAWLNRGKESAVLDLKAGDDAVLLRRMLSKADVLVQNLAPGAMDRMGLPEEVLERDFPHLIAVSIVGYGQDTDYADMKAYDLLVQAESGLCSVTGTPDVPSKVGVSIADITTGMNAHAAVLEALISSGITGRGQHIEVSMFDGMADAMTVPLLHLEQGGQATARHGLSHASIYPYGPFDCADGTVMIAVQNNAEFGRLCADVLERPDIPSDARFATNADRVKNRWALDKVLRPVFSAMSVSDAKMRLKSAGVAFGQYSEVSDLSQHPALRRVEVAIADGTVQMPRPAGREAGFAPGPVPALGQHTDAVRKEFSDNDD